MRNIYQKILTAALGLSDIFIKFLEIYHIYLHNFKRYSSENNELKLLFKMSKFKLYTLQSPTTIY